MMKEYFTCTYNNIKRNISVKESNIYLIDFHKRRLFSHSNVHIPSFSGEGWMNIKGMNVFVENKLFFLTDRKKKYIIYWRHKAKLVFYDVLTYFFHLLNMYTNKYWNSTQNKMEKKYCAWFSCFYRFQINMKRHRQRQNFIYFFFVCHWIKEKQIWCRKVLKGGIWERHVYGYTYIRSSWIPI